MTSTQWTYRVPRFPKPSQKCNLTRGVLNEQKTGSFVGLISNMELNQVHVLVGCPVHGDWWDDIASIQESSFADCEYCNNSCYPVLPDGGYDTEAKGFEA